MTDKTFESKALAAISLPEFAELLAALGKFSAILASRGVCSEQDSSYVARHALKLNTTQRGQTRLATATVANAGIRQAKAEGKYSGKQTVITEPEEQADDMAEFARVYAMYKSLKNGESDTAGKKSRTRQTVTR